MAYLADSYVITGADIVTNFAGRAYNFRTGTWETVSGGKMSDGIYTDYRLRYMHILIQNALGDPWYGAAGHLYCIMDPRYTEFVARLACRPLQGGLGIIHWEGDMACPAGVQWKINNPSSYLAGGETVVTRAYYEGGGQCTTLTASETIRTNGMK